MSGNYGGGLHIDLFGANSMVLARAGDTLRMALPNGAAILTEETAILLVEDEPLILMGLELAAEDCGCRPLAASCVRAALALIESADPAPKVAVLDVSLQDDETSMPVARELERRGIPYILHSGNFDRGDGMQALDAEFVPKPASAELVIATALECLAKSAPDGRRAAGV